MELIPIYREQCKVKFVDIEEFIEPIKLTSGEEALTGFLKVNTRVDILSISMSSKLIEQGLLEHTDTVSGDIRISKLLIQKPNTGYSVIDIDIPFTQTDVMNGRQFVINQNDLIPINAFINVETGECQVDFIKSTELDIVGFKLNIATTPRPANNLKETT